jgi:hypothetical protein
MAKRLKSSPTHTMTTARPTAKTSIAKRLARRCGAIPDTRFTED